MLGLDLRMSPVRMVGEQSWRSIVNGHADRGLVLVAGGGIGGLAVAVGLSRLGFRVGIFEQAEDFREVGAGVQLGPNGIRALLRLGFREEVERYAWRPGALVMRDALSGDEITRLPLTDGFVQRFREHYCVIHRADLLMMLIEKCKADPAIQLRTSARVVSFAEDGAGVSIELSNGQRARGVALIGADGLRSVVRQGIVNDGPPRPAHHVVYRGVVPRNLIPDELWSPDVVMWSGPKADFVHYPLRRGELFNLVATFRSDRELDPTDIQGSREEMMKPFQGYRSEVGRLLELLTAERKWSVTDREPIKNWSRGRVTLLGDAAHPMLQYLAQGACQALEDAVQLSDEVERRPEDLESAFQAYANARYLRTARVQITARYFIDVCQAGGMFAEVRAKVFARRSLEQAYDGVAWLYSPDETQAFR